MGDEEEEGGGGDVRMELLQTYCLKTTKQVCMCDDKKTALLG